MEKTDISVEINPNVARLCWVKAEWEFMGIDYCQIGLVKYIAIFRFFATAKFLGILKISEFAFFCS